jgi:hypothetical protein
MIGIFDLLFMLQCCSQIAYLAAVAEGLARARLSDSTSVSRQAHTSRGPDAVNLVGGNASLFQIVENFACLHLLAINAT